MPATAGDDDDGNARRKFGSAWPLTQPQTIASGNSGSTTIASGTSLHACASQILDSLRLDDVELGVHYPYVHVELSHVIFDEQHNRP